VSSRVRLKPDGTQCRTGGELKGKLANGVGSQYSHTPSEHGVYSITTARLPAVDWNDPPADLNELVRFGERRNLFSARVPSHFKRTLRPARGGGGAVVPIRIEGRGPAVRSLFMIHSYCTDNSGVCYCRCRLLSRPPPPCNLSSRCNVIKWTADR